MTRDESKSGSQERINVFVSLRERESKKANGMGGNGGGIDRWMREIYEGRIYGF
jgi:hypothetical protein